MFARNLLPAVRTCQRALVPVRQIFTKRDLPVFYRRRRGPWDDLPSTFRASGPLGMIDEYIKDTFNQLERMMWPTWTDWTPRVAIGPNAEIVEAKMDKGGLLLKMNVSHYEPDELKIKVLKDRLVITGKHQQKADEHGYVAREFSREFLLPEEVEQDTIASRLTDDGHLVITAKVKGGTEEEGRTIAIEKGSGGSSGSSSSNTNSDSKSE